MDHVTTIIGSILFGAAAFFVASLIHKSSARMPADSVRRWTARLEAVAHERVDVGFRAAELDSELASLISEMPKDFIPATFLAARLGYSVERAVVAEAKRRGIYSEPIAAALSSTDPLPGQDAPPPSESKPLTPALDPVASTLPPTTAWQGGKLVPFAARAKGLVTT